MFRDTTIQELAAQSFYLAKEKSTLSQRVQQLRGLFSDPSVGSKKYSPANQPFNLVAALQLLGCSEEAYLIPQVDNQQFIEKRSKTQGLQITYGCSSFLKSLYDGVLVVSVQNGLIQQARCGTFVVVELEDRESYTTAIDEKTGSPKWNQELMIYARTPQTQTLKVYLHDSKSYKANQPIASGQLELSDEVLQQQEPVQLYMCTNVSKDYGYINIAAKYHTFEDFPDPLSAADSSGSSLLAKVDAPMEYKMSGLQELPAIVNHSQALKSDLSQELSQSTEGLALGNQKGRSRWQQLAAELGITDADNYHFIAYVDHNGSHTQANVYTHVGRKEIVVAFRGTQMEVRRDRLTDITFFMRPFITIGGANGGNVHSGFRDSYYSVREPLWQMIEKIKGDDDEWVFKATGHSMGGALATLFATEVGLDFNMKMVQMYNAGSPRVGAIKFKRVCQIVVDQSWRMRNVRDIVCTIPFSLGFFFPYVHVDGAVQMNLNDYKILELGLAVVHDNSRETPSKNSSLLGDLRPLNPPIIHVDDIGPLRSRLFGICVNVQEHYLSTYYQSMVTLVGMVKSSREQSMDMDMDVHRSVSAGM